jgi:hypothetical protein
MYRWYEAEGFGHVAAYLATLDLTDFNPKAPPLKTPAFWAIADANRPSEDSEIADLIEQVGNPPVVTIEWLAKCAIDGDLWEFFKDRKHRAAIRHRLDTAGYEPVRNDLAQDGMWKIEGARRVVYARKELPIREQLRAAKTLAAGCVWQCVAGAFPGNGGAFQEAHWEWSQGPVAAMAQAAE